MGNNISFPFFAPAGIPNTHVTSIWTVCQFADNDGLDDGSFNEMLSSYSTYIDTSGLPLVNNNDADFFYTTVGNQETYSIISLGGLAFPRVDDLVNYLNGEIAVDFQNKFQFFNDNEALQIEVYATAVFDDRVLFSVSDVAVQKAMGLESLPLTPASLQGYTFTGNPVLKVPLDLYNSVTEELFLQAVGYSPEEDGLQLTDVQYFSVTEDMSWQIVCDASFVGLLGPQAYTDPVTSITYRFGNITAVPKDLNVFQTSSSKSKPEVVAFLLAGAALSFYQPWLAVLCLLVALAFELQGQSSSNGPVGTPLKQSTTLKLQDFSVSDRDMNRSALKETLKKFVRE